MGRNNNFYLVILMILSINGRFRAFLLITYFSFIETLGHSLKNIFHEPRIFMIDGTILQKECSLSYGYPSGHVMLTSSFLGYIFIDYIKERRDFSPLAKIGIALLFMMTTMTMAFSRVYAAAHTLD